ncbi:MAG: acylneuraminate cytidylyltransferase [Flavobacteriales bacterium]|nr:acylneuraminate cytidylyltransferase [Flavobacteriales bacterium]|tara:strand:+ start:65468 stop:67096 length:1629 start_codon:yes stop_codon:yes gene_type:complete
MNILFVIPARGGSKGIPRKNLRVLSGKPLLYYAINNAINSEYTADIYVSSEDDEILNTAKKFGVATHKRDVSISDDQTTLDPVIYDCYKYAKHVQRKEYDLIITIQPTSPLLTSNSLDLAISKMIQNINIDTLIAAKDSTHLSWRKEGDHYIPNYKERLNRQYLSAEFTETGAFLITRNTIISKNNRIGSNVDLFLLSGGEEIDIDTYEDWNLCEYYLRRKHILFVVSGNNIIGLGHVYNTLIVANDILNHQITFLVDNESELALKVIQSKNYPVLIQKKDDIIEDIKRISPDIIINDRLDTSEDYIKSLKEQEYKVINFEDLGSGAEFSDAVINAIYPQRRSLPAHYFGQEYFILRDEFILSDEKVVQEEVNNILIAFGGVDPNNYTEKVIRTVNSYCKKNGIKITVILGFGYERDDTIRQYDNIHVKHNVSNISDYMLEADLIFTSAGRTIYEVASIGTPTIVMGQNEREMTHFFANAEYGFSNLGLGYNISNDDILNEFLVLIKSYDIRKEMSKLMKSQDLKSGRKRVHKLIQHLIQEQ